MKRAIKVLLLSVIMSFILSSICYAEEEVPVEIDNIRNSFTGFYKNFIVEMGGINIKLFSPEIMSDTVKTPLWEYNVYPKQWQGKTEVKRIFSRGKDSYLIQKNDGVIKLNDVKQFNDKIKYSNNIPQITKFEDENGDTNISYVYFNQWKHDNGQLSFTNVDEWIKYNEGEMINLLGKDLGEDNNSAYKNIETGEQMKLSEWLYQASSNGYTPSLVIQPLTIYPYTTEQIYCSNLSVAKEYIFQWGIDILDTIKFYDTEVGSKKVTKQIKGDTFTMTEKDISLFEFLSKDIYYDCGILKMKEMKDIVEEKESGYNRSGGNVNYDMGVVDINEMEQPKYISLTHKGTLEHSVPYSTKGFWVNYQKRTKEIVYTEKKMKEKYKTELQKMQKNLGKTYTESDLSFDDFIKMYGYEKDGNDYVLKKVSGMGDTTHIKTDHNKYIVVVYESEDELVKKMQEKLSGMGVLYEFCSKLI